LNVFERSLLIKKRLHYKSITVLSLYVAPHYLRQAGSWASAKGGQASRPSKLKTKKATPLKMQPNQTRHLAPSLKRSTGSFWTLGRPLPAAGRLLGFRQRRTSFSPKQIKNKKSNPLKMQPNQTRHLAPSLKRSTGSFWTLALHYLRQAGSWASAKGGQASRPSKLKTKKATPSKCNQTKRATSLLR
jgi:hypothetical protein